MQDVGICKSILKEKKSQESYKLKYWKKDQNIWELIGDTGISKKHLASIVEPRIVFWRCNNQLVLNKSY